MKRVKQFIQTNTTKILVTLVVVAVLELLSPFPYIGALLLSPYPAGKFVVLGLFIGFYFRTNATVTRLLALFWWMFACLTAVFQRESIAELAGVVCMMLIGVSFLQEWYEGRKKRTV